MFLWKPFIIPPHSIQKGKEDEWVSGRELSEPAPPPPPLPDNIRSDKNPFRFLRKEKRDFKTFIFRFQHQTNSKNIQHTKRNQRDLKEAFTLCWTWPDYLQVNLWQSNKVLWVCERRLGVSALTSERFKMRSWPRATCVAWSHSHWIGLDSTSSWKWNGMDRFYGDALNPAPTTRTRGERAAEKRKEDNRERRKQWGESVGVGLWCSGTGWHITSPLSAVPTFPTPLANIRLDPKRKMWSHFRSFSPNHKKESSGTPRQARRREGKIPGESEFPLPPPPAYHHQHTEFYFLPNLIRPTEIIHTENRKDPGTRWEGSEAGPEENVNHISQAYVQSQSPSSSFLPRNETETEICEMGWKWTSKRSDERTCKKKVI